MEQTPEEARRARQRANHLRYRQRHLETIRARERERARAYRETRREELAAKARAYNATHREQKKQHDKAYRARERERIRDREKAYRATEAGRAVNQRSRQKRAEQIRQWRKNYRRTHTAAIRARIKRNYEANREKRVAYTRAWQAAYPERVKANRLKHEARYKTERRMREKASTRWDFSLAQWQEIKEASQHCCVYCERPHQRLTMDHLTPLLHGGEHSLWNILPACKSCNSKKGRGTVLQAVQPFLLTVARPQQPREKASR